MILAACLHKAIKIVAFGVFLNLFPGCHKVVLAIAVFLY